MNNEKHVDVDAAFAFAVATLKAEHDTSHFTHLFVSVVTCGIWVPIWILVHLENTWEKDKIERRANKSLGWAAHKSLEQTPRPEPKLFSWPWSDDIDSWLR